LAQAIAKISERSFSILGANKTVAIHLFAIITLSLDINADGLMANSPTDFGRVQHVSGGNLIRQRNFQNQVITTSTGLKYFIRLFQM
jgi:hypothetical protein